MQEFSVKQSNLDFRTREAYKMLRTNIEFSGDNNKVIFIKVRGELPIRERTQLQKLLSEK